MADIFRSPLVINRREPAPVHRLLVLALPSLLTTTLAVVVATLPPGQSYAQTAQVLDSRPRLAVNADTTHGTPKTLTLDAQFPARNPPPPLVRPQLDVVDTSKGTPKPLIEDAQLPFFVAAHFSPSATQKAGWLPADTTQRQPTTLQIVIGEVPLPLSAGRAFPYQQAPGAVQLSLNADTTRGVSKTLTLDAQAPVFNAPQFGPNAPPVAQRQPPDTSWDTPLVLFPAAIVPLPPGEASFVGLARNLWQPDDTSQGTLLALVPLELPIGESSFVGLARNLWQPADTSQELLLPLIPLEQPPGESSFVGLARNLWQPADVSQDAYGVLFPVVSVPLPVGTATPVFSAPPPVLLTVNTSQSVPTWSIPPYVPPVPVVSTGDGGGGAIGGGKRELRKFIDELDVFKKLDKRKPGQSIIEALRELDEPEVEAVVQAIAVPASPRELKTVAKSAPEVQKLRGQIAELRAEVRAFQKEREAREVQAQFDADEEELLDLLLVLMQ